MRRGILIVLCAVLGCYATASGMRAKRADAEAGVAKDYPKPCRYHFTVAKRAVAKLRLDLLDEDSENGEILARRGSRADKGWMGDRLAIWFDKTETGGCRIRVYARGQNAFEAGGGDWPGRVFRAMKLIRDAEEE
jgi:hypothetical protein